MNLLQANSLFILAFVTIAIVALAIALNVQSLLRAARPRHAVLLAAMLLPPILFAAAALGLRVPLPAASSSPGIVVLASSGSAASVDTSSGVLPRLLFAVWLTGVILALARIALEAARWRAIAARAEVITDSAVLSRFESPCVLARSAEVAEPAVIGIADPIVVLPAAYDLEPAELDAVFAHELAHIDRRDNLTALVVQIICALFWFDPLHRTGRRTLVELRERVCDELVLDRGCDAQAYVNALARSTQSTLEHQHAVACMSRLNLQERMESIMSHETSRRSPIWITRALLTAVVAIVGIGFATFSPAPLLTAGEPGKSEYDFDVRVTPHEDGKHSLTVRIDTPDGPITSVAVVRSLPDVRTITAGHGGLTYRVEVNLAADGSAVGKFEVLEGVRTLASSTRGFLAPLKPPPARRLSEGMTPPKAISRIEPVYPEEAKKARIAGIVIIEATINEAGVVTEASVVKPLPFGLDQAALDAIQQWRFEPATQDGRPVPVKFHFTFNFKTDDGKAEGAVPPPPPRP